MQQHNNTANQAPRNNAEEQLLRSLRDLSLSPGKGRSSCTHRCRSLYLTDRLTIYQAYNVSGPGGTAVTKDWYRAGAAVQQSPGTKARKIPHDQGHDVLEDRPRIQGKAKAYVVRVGRTPGVYTNW